MDNIQELRDKVMSQAQGAMSLYTAHVAIANGIFETLDKLGSATLDALSTESKLDIGYLTRWCDIAYALEYLDLENDKYQLTEMGKAWLPGHPANLRPFAVQTVVGAHMAEKAANFIKTGERPGESVLEEIKSVLPLYGPISELNYSGIFKNEIVNKVPIFKEVNEKNNGLVVDLGCGNGWYLRTLLKSCSNLRGIGLDGLDDNIRLANEMAENENLGNRLKFQKGDIHHFTVNELVDLITMNRSLHHVWSDKENVFRIFNDNLKDGGAVVIWDFNWPKEKITLKHPSKRKLVFGNLGEHIQGNHLLRSDEIEDEFKKIGMKTEVYLFANENDAVVVGRK